MHSQNPLWPAEVLVNITPSDTDTTNVFRQIYVGISGDISVVTTHGDNIVFKNAVAGTTIGPFFLAKVKATGTTASNLVGFI